MATKETTRTGFRIANGPVVRKTEEDTEKMSDFGELPRLSGAPMLFAIARDPRTLFVYWNIDWDSEFAAAVPVDRQVYLRVLKPNGSAESEPLIEPLLGSFYAAVAKPRENYRVELGYYNQSGAWNSVAISDAVTTPPDAVSENVVVDVATVPFHLSFQKMIDLFEKSNDGNALTTAIARLQDKDRELMNEAELEIVRAMETSFDEIAASRRAFNQRAGDETLRKRAEAILGFGSTSPARGFGGSSWS